MAEAEGFTDPAPSSVIVTAEAVPPKVFPPTVTAVLPHVLPAIALKATSGGLTHAHSISKILPDVMHPAALRTVRK